MVEYFRSESAILKRRQLSRYEKLIELFRRLKDYGAAGELASLLSTGGVTKAQVIACLERNGYTLKRSLFTGRYKLVHGDSVVVIDTGEKNQMRIKGPGFELEAWPNGEVSIAAKPPKK